eukprot:TRINITY_DN5950_c1_g1_i1.p1 TRINITY_DN5950_c1_g1~~TRINITY_DN5950_c1_g1_i1.p1  ORF type:complete len:286 (-),score=51.65 TRINITY_DN5950_c1_g1_i1:134-874(-)
MVAAAPASPDDAGGAPDAGDAPAKKMSGCIHGAMAFRMLDQRGLGRLNRGQARCWLRCLGWCLPDAKLDKILGISQEATASRSLGLEDSDRWDLRRLQEIHASRDVDSENLDEEALSVALRSFSNRHNERSVEISMLHGYVASASASSGLTPALAETVLDACGVGHAAGARDSIGATGRLDSMVLAKMLLACADDPPLRLDVPRPPCGGRRTAFPASEELAELSLLDAALAEVRRQKAAPGGDAGA